MAQRESGRLTAIIHLPFSVILVTSDSLAIPGSEDKTPLLIGSFSSKDNYIAARPYSTDHFSLALHS